MRIAMINLAPITWYPTTFRALNLAKSLARRNYEVDFFLPYNKEDFQKYSNSFAGIKFSYWRKKRMPIFFRPLEVLFRLKKLMGKKYDLIHGIKPRFNSGLIAYFYSKFKHIPFVLDCDEAEYLLYLKAWKKTRVYQKIVRRVLEYSLPRLSNHITVVSKALYNEYVKFNDVTYIPNGFDPEVFREKKMISIKNKYNLAGKKLLVYVGSLSWAWDADLTIPILYWVKKYIEEVRLLIVGDGPKKDYIISLAKKLGVRKNLIITSYQPYEYIPTFLALGDVLIFPLRRNIVNEKRCPMKIAEYMASGKPIVASAVGEAKYMLKDVALLCNSSDEKDFAELVIKILTDKKLSDKLGSRAKEKAYKNYTWDNLTSRLIEVYNSLVN